MELLYIWIENYKNIEKQGFNFSPKYHFDFDFESKNLTCKENKQALPENFFDKDISNVTAIIGENGSGKSTLIEAMFTVGEYFKGLFVRKTENEFEIFTDYELKQTLTKRVKHSSENEFNNLSVFSYFDFDNKHDKDYHETTECTIFYANYFASNSSSVKNVSFNQSTGDLLVNDIQNYYTEDSKKQTIFLVKFDYKQISELKTPHGLVIKPCINSIKTAKSIVENIIDNIIARHRHFISPLDENRVDVLKKQISSLDELQALINASDDPNYFTKIIKLDNIIDFIVYVYYDCLIKAGISTEFPSKIWMAKQIEELLTTSLENKIILDKMIETLFELIDQEVVIKNKYSKHKDALKNFLHYFEKFAIKNQHLVSFARFTKLPYMEIDVSSNLSLVIEDLLKYCIDLNPLNYEWFGLSTGESYLFSFYSRMYAVIDHHTKDKKDDIINYYILLDEPDLGLHPQWQKQLLKNLISVLPKIFKDKKIQLILTSHSPFLVSDLPKENIIFLEKDAEGKCKVSKLEDRKNTFGANIHSLFTDSFFMSGGLIGDFAKDKINKVIELLENSQHLPAEQISYCEQIIGMIGEPIIKNMLQKQLDSKRLQKVEDHETRIKNLENELERLKNLKS